MKKYLPPAIVAMASAITHFIYFGYPAQVVFDETFAGGFLASYAKGVFYFDVHPPLAKLVVYVFGFLTGASYGGKMSAIGDALPHSIVLLRLVPIVCGFLLPLVIYAVSRNVGLSPLSSMTAGLLVAFENSLIVQSRFILFDIMLVLSGFVAVLLYQEYRKRIGQEKRGACRIFLLGSAVFAAVAFSIKWTGLAFPLMIVIFEWLASINRCAIRSLWKRSWSATRSVFSFVALYVCVGLALYIGVFALHFSLLPKNGPGDDFMSPQFHQDGFVAKLVDLNIEMYKANAYRMPQHQYQSSWWSWPIMERPIFYWQGKDEYIYLIGNPLIYWFGTVSIVSLAGYALWRRKNAERKISLSFILIGFLVNYVPFIFITRPMFLYHYETALVMSAMAIAWLLDGMACGKRKLVMSSLVLALCISSFIYFSPLTYGLHLSDAQLQARMWLPSWR